MIFVDVNENIRMSKNRLSISQNAMHRPMKPTCYSEGVGHVQARSQSGPYNSHASHHFSEEIMAALIDAINVKRKMYFEFENAPFYCLESEISDRAARNSIPHSE